MNVDEAKRIVQADMPDRAVTYADVVQPITAGRVLAAEVERLQRKVDVYTETSDLLDRTLAALEKQLNEPLEDAEAICRCGHHVGLHTGRGICGVLGCVCLLYHEGGE